MGTLAWGLVVLRTDYSSQSKWEAYIDWFKRSVEVQCKRANAEPMLEYLAWETIEDANTMDGMPMEETRQVFQKWADAQQHWAYKRYNRSMIDRLMLYTVVDKEVLDAFDPKGDLKRCASNYYWGVSLRAALRREERIKEMEEKRACREVRELDEMDFAEQQYGDTAWKKMYIKHYLMNYVCIYRPEAFERIWQGKDGIWTSS